MPKKLAHDLSRERTDDVRIREEIDFPGMLLPEKILNGLSSNGFLKPSPIQLKALPLGRCGFDLILQAKSGTGKTCVFTIIALEMIEVERSDVQTLIVAPTREIAIQITEVVRLIGSGIQGLKVHSFIGGTPFGEDKNKLSSCHIAVGAPGRLKHLIQKKVLKTERIRFFVLDEADKLMESSFLKDIKFIFKELPTNKQVIVASATMPPELNKILTEHMKSPVRVCPHGEGEAPILIGVRQLVIKVPAHPTTLQQLNLKVYGLVKLLSCVPFRQCIVFSNYLTRAESICHELERRGWPCKHTAGVLDQNERMEAFSALLQSRCRILLSTDLTSRGVDAPLVDLVVNLDLPNNGATYLHRIGRAGRQTVSRLIIRLEFDQLDLVSWTTSMYGSHGLAVTLAAEGAEISKFSQMLQSVGATATVIMPETFPENIWDCDLEQFHHIGTNPTTLKILESDIFNSIKNHPAHETRSEGDHKPSENETVVLKTGGDNLIVNQNKSKVIDGVDSTYEPEVLSQIEALEISDFEESILNLTNVMLHSENKIDCIETVDDMLKSCQEYCGEDKKLSKTSDYVVTTNVDHFDRVLKTINERDSSDFKRRLQSLKNHDVISVMKALSLGENWSPQNVIQSIEANCHTSEDNGITPVLGTDENETPAIKPKSDVICVNPDCKRKDEDASCKMEVLGQCQTQEVVNIFSKEKPSSMKDNVPSTSKVSNIALDWGKCDISLSKKPKNVPETMERKIRSLDRGVHYQTRKKCSSSSSSYSSTSHQSNLDSEEESLPHTNLNYLHCRTHGRGASKTSNSLEEFNAWYQEIKVLPFIYRCMGSKHLPLEGNAIIHLDSHPDMLIPKGMSAEAVWDKNILFEHLSIENWMLPAAYAGHFGALIWVKPPWANQMEDSSSSFQIGQHTSTGQIRLIVLFHYFPKEL
ncbi:hypothetical protein J437_LFUL006697 [Ladona fulva]|uniref:RNA helicase n=1 Tax=Ladona fulva TaxID=123851 RepID=A0A8K0NXC2_LADFU|nr:hypothetical protein J437_LFUL006697 [Ladona fulva]